MATKIHLAVGVDYDDHFPPCHPGCTTWQHGQKGCFVWTREELFRRCEAEVANMPADLRSLKIARMHTHRDAYTLKTPARFEFITTVEWTLKSREELGRWMHGTATRGTKKGWGELAILQETANIWNSFRQDRALRALYAYGQISAQEVNAAMAKHPFETLWTEVS